MKSLVCLPKFRFFVFFVCFSFFSYSVLSNVVYVDLANTPVAATVKLYRNTARLRQGAAYDYEIITDGSSLKRIDFTFTLDEGDVILVDYDYI